MPDRGNLPKAGDIVIHQRAQSGVAYLVSQAQGALEISCHTYEEALTRAETFASRTHVDVWYTVGERDFQRVALHRTS